MRAESLKGHLDGMILAVVGAAPAHGYAVIEELKRRSGGTFDLPEGTVYPALHRLEAEGLLSSAWGSESGRRRRGDKNHPPGPAPPRGRGAPGGGVSPPRGGGG